MTLLDLLTAFEETDKKLNTAEVALFISLALVWNRLRRPEWFSVSRTELMHKAGMTDAKRVDRTRQSLEEKGLILTQTGGRTSPRKYHIIPLGAHSPQIRGSQPLDTRGSQPLEDTKVKTIRGSQPLEKGLTALSLGAHSPTSQRERENSSCSNTPTTCSTNSIDSNEPERETPDVPKEVMDAYQDEIRPVTSAYELERLADDVDRYGKETVIKAIHIATMNNKRFLGYIEGVLKRWETEGYDEEGKHAEHGRDNRTTNDEDELDKWAEELTRGL